MKGKESFKDGVKGELIRLITVCLRDRNHPRLIPSLQHVGEIMKMGDFGFHCSVDVINFIKTFFFSPALINEGTSPLLDEWMRDFPDNIKRSSREINQ